jgi:prepilin-type processing-associated H-X9-DG protein
MLESIAEGVLAPGSAILLGGSTDPDDFNAFNRVTNGDLDVDDGIGTAGGDSILHLREGIERFFITDINNPGASAKAQSEVFVMWDRISTNATDFNHIPGGSNILYLDGHASFVRFPAAEAPVQPGFARFDQTINEGS